MQKKHFAQQLRKLAAVGLVATSTLVGCSEDKTVSTTKTTLKVMTRNVYLGGDLTVLLGANSATELPAAAGKLWGMVQQTQFTERAKKLADEIAQNQPDVVGLQEITLYRTQTPSDFVRGNTAVNAATVDTDFLAILQSELSKRGLKYSVAVLSENADQELPVTTNGTAFFDVRFTDRGVVLAKETVKVSNPTTKMYDAKFELNLAGGAAKAQFMRAYQMADMELNGVKFRFVNTHLEAFLAPAQEAQAKELLTVLDKVTLPIVVTGDFNSPADKTTPATYSLMTAKFTDAFKQAKPNDNGYTCCQDEDLKNAASKLNQRIDFIFFKGNIKATDAVVVGKEAATDKTSTGLWTSDHAGVVATLEVQQ